MAIFFLGFETLYSNLGIGFDHPWSEIMPRWALGGSALRKNSRVTLKSRNDGHDMSRNIFADINAHAPPESSSGRDWHRILEGG